MSTTRAGAAEETVLPMPNCPKAFSPQQFTVPSERTAQVWPMPAARVARLSGCAAPFLKVSVAVNVSIWPTTRDGCSGVSRIAASEKGESEVEVKIGPGLLRTPPIVTTTGPVVAPSGTVAITWLSIQPRTAARVPLKVTMPGPSLPPNPDPVMITDPPEGPDSGKSDEIVGRKTERTEKI